MTRDLPSGDLVDRLRRFCFHLLRYPNYGALTFTPAGLSPADHASLTWTHLRTKNRQQTKNDYLTAKAPYRFESVSLQRRVCCEPFSALRLMMVKIAKEKALPFESLVPNDETIVTGVCC